jgi:prepilin-type N-terminal cleavage/methylation domain-containing protein
MNKQSAQIGFSLIEILLVITVTGMLLLIIANITPAMSLITTSNHESTARQIAAKKIEQIRAQGYDNIANGITPISDPRLSSLTQGAAATTVVDCPSNICTISESVKSVTIQVSWVENNKPAVFSLSTLISKGGLK